MASSSFAADATIAARSFGVDAWVIGDRWRHHRVRDHFGPEDARYVVLYENVGPYPAGTPVHYIIEDLFAKINQLENTERRRFDFSVDAFLSAIGTYGFGYLRMDAAILVNTETTLTTLDAWKQLGSTFSADAIIMPAFTIDAFLL